MGAPDPAWAMFLGAIAMAVLVLVATLVPTLLQIRRTAAALEEVALRVKSQIDPTLNEAQGLVRDVSALTRLVESDVKAATRIVEDVAEAAAYAKTLATLVKTEVERPMLGLVTTIVGLRRGLDAFRTHRAGRAARRRPRGGSR